MTDDLRPNPLGLPLEPDPTHPGLDQPARPDVDGPRDPIADAPDGDSLDLPGEDPHPGAPLTPIPEPGAA